MTYYNGTILSGTGANTIDLDVTLDLDIKRRIFRPYFDFTFELINTVNTADPIASADFVYLDDARSSRTLIFDGQEFEFELRFGETTADGFSEFDRFNVIENRDASVNLDGTFNLLGPVNDPGVGGNSPILGGLIIDDDPAIGVAYGILYQKIGYLDPEEFVGSLLEPAKKLAESARSSREIAINGEEDANKASIDINANLDSGDFLTAEELYLKALEAADTAEIEADRAEAFALEAQPFLQQAKDPALNDPKATDEAIQVTDEVNAASFYATRARDAATAARLAATTAETAWNRAMLDAPTSNAEALARYYAGRAKLEKDAAKSAREVAENLARAAADAAAEMSRMIGEGKYFEAESHFNKIIPNALQARNAVDTAADFALRSREAALEASALAISEPEAIDEADAANSDAGAAENEALLARAEADTASGIASIATSEWDSLVAAGANGDASAFATYLADRADAAEAGARAARDDAKSASEDAVKMMEDSQKKAGEGRLTEAESLAQNAAHYSASAQTAADLVLVIANEARSLAVQTGVIANSLPSTNSIANQAGQPADNAESYAQEAQQLADAAAAAPALIRKKKKRPESLLAGSRRF